MTVLNILTTVNGLYQEWFQGPYRLLLASLGAAWLGFMWSLWRNRAEFVDYVDWDAMAGVIAWSLFAGVAIAILPITLTLVALIGPFIGPFYMARWYAKRELMVQRITNRLTGE